VHLVDEQDAVTRRLDFFDDLFETLLKFATIFGAGDERSNIESEEALVLERLGYVARDDSLGETLDDGRLSDTGLPNEDGIVLGTTGENLDDPLDFRFPSYDGIEALGTSGGSEVDTELIDRRRSACLPRAAPARRGGLLGSGLREDAGGLGSDPLEIDAKTLQDTSGNPFTLSDETEQKMFSADVMVVEPTRFINRELNNLFRPRGQSNFAEHGAVAAADDEFDSGSNLAQLHTQVGEHFGGNTIALPDEAEEKVLGANVVVIKTLGLFLGQRQYSPSALSEFVKSVGHKGTSGSQGSYQSVI
jgi:hypothetical protein